MSKKRSIPPPEICWSRSSIIRAKSSKWLEYSTRISVLSYFAPLWGVMRLRQREVLWFESLTNVDLMLLLLSPGCRQISLSLRKQTMWTWAHRSLAADAQVTEPLAPELNPQTTKTLIWKNTVWSHEKERLIEWCTKYVTRCVVSYWCKPQDWNILLVESHFYWSSPYQLFQLKTFSGFEVYFDVKAAFSFISRSGLWASCWRGFCCAVTRQLWKRLLLLCSFRKVDLYANLCMNTSVALYEVNCPVIIE